MRALHLGPCSEQAGQQSRRGGEGRIGDNVERPARQPEVRRIGLDHDREPAEPLPEDCGAPRV